MKLLWMNGFARANGWGYMLQSETVRGEGRFHSLYVRPPLTSSYLAPSGTNLTPSLPVVTRFGEGTIAYVKAQAQAHADLVARASKS